MAKGESAFDRDIAAGTVKTTVVSAKGIVLANVLVNELGEDDTAAPIHGALGVVSRPLDENADGAAEAVCVRSSDGLVIASMKDLRIEQQSAVPLEKGTIRLAGYRGATVSVSVAASGTGSVITMYVPFAHDGDGVPAKAHVLTMDPTSGQESVVLGAASGAALVLASDGSATCKSGNGENFISITNDGVTFSGDLRMPNSNLVVGDPSLAQDVALAQPLVDVLKVAGPMLLAIANAVNTLAPGSIPAPDIATLTMAVALYLTPGAPAAPLTRAPRIRGQPGP